MNTQIATLPAYAAERLPESADVRAWTPQQRRLMEFAGLAREIPAPELGEGAKKTVVLNPAVAEAFIAVCRRTGLDPFAKQIYAAEMSGKWTVVVGVDGFRVVAQRSDGYAGQIGPQWATGRIVKVPYVDPTTGKPLVVDGSIVMVDGPEWVSEWVPEMYGLKAQTDDNGKPLPIRPVAARVGILRKGFAAPLWQVVTWAEFGMEPRFRGDNWGTRPAHMLGIRAETHALRRAFPNDLSGLYTPEDLEQVDDSAAEQEIAETIAAIERITDLDELTRVYHEHHAVGMPDRVRAAIMAHAGMLKGESDESGQNDREPGQEQANETPVDESPTPEPEPRKSPRSASKPSESVDPYIADGDTAGAYDDDETAQYEAQAAAEHAAWVAEQEGREP